MRKPGRFVYRKMAIFLWMKKIMLQYEILREVAPSGDDYEMRAAKAIYQIETLESENAE